MNDAVDLHTLQEELKKLGITVVSGRQNTVISVKIKGLAGRALMRGLRLADQLLQEKIKQAIKAYTDPATKLFTDPTFGPCSSDPDGAAAICKAGAAIPSKGGSQHQAKTLGLLQRGKIRWERPIYARDDEVDGDSSQEVDDENGNDIYSMSASKDVVFATKATLFADGSSSGDVIQGQLGDCWFLSALSVVATRPDLLKQSFYQGDQHKMKGLFVCKFLKNFVWNYVVIDDRIPVFGFTDKRAGKPYFARCRNPNELWVSMIEKAYAKLHGSYEALIGGFVDCALNDLTGMCSEQVILKEEFPGFYEDPYAPAKPQQKFGDPFWEKLLRYKQTGTLMGCSIQPSATASKDVAAESSAGNGLYFKHAYALVDAAEIKTTKGESVRLVKLRNPWGMGEWTGPWSDSSEERIKNEDAIEKYFKILKRIVGANAEKRMFMTVNANGKVGIDEISQEEVVEINANDGTFFMSFDAWMQSFTHFFAGIDFPDSWHGRRTEGSWNEANCGGNITKSTWVNNPRFEFVLDQRAQIFVSLSQEDPRGSEKLKIVPVGFHICTLTPKANEPNKFELGEPDNKPDAYYRLYEPEARENIKSGKWSEYLPPAIIPGSVISGIDDDGTPQAAYTFKQAVSVEATIEPGRYCIIPSMYMRTDKATGSTNVGNFWISVYSDKPTFRLEGGEKIVEEEEGDEEETQTTVSNGLKRTNSNSQPIDKRSLNSSLGKKSVTISTSSAIAAEKRRRYEKDKDELLRQAKRYGIGLRELRVAFAKTAKVQKIECRHKMQKLGFRLDGWDDERIALVFGGLDDNAAAGVIFTEKILKLFTPNIQEEKMACELPDMEEDDDSFGGIHREGVLELELHGANGLAVSDKHRPLSQRKIQIQAPEFSGAQKTLRRRIASEILERDPLMARLLRHFAKKSDLLAKTRYASSELKHDVASRTIQLQDAAPIGNFYGLLEKEYTARLQFRTGPDDDIENVTLTSQTPAYSQRDGKAPFPSGSSSINFSNGVVNAASTDAAELHKSNRIRDLEAKRSTKLALLLQHKQQAFGDAEKTAALPRLIGGRKSGASRIKCIDCGVRVLVGGRGSQLAEGANSYPCNGSNCVNVLCSACYILLPAKSKLCEECFQHEISPVEKLGEQLRVILIEKIGASHQQRSHLEVVFKSFDVDGSGSLSPQEFEKMLQILDIRPVLTQGQKDYIVEQFDTNGDGEISLSEFKNWILKDRVWEETAVPITSSEDKAQSAVEVFDTVISPVCEHILNLAFDAYTFSTTVGTWSRSRSSTAGADAQNNRQKEKETGSIIFQRIVSLAISSGSAVTTAEKVFEHFDGDESGQIDLPEFETLLGTLGIHLRSDDSRLLMNRLGAVEVNGADTISRSAFMSYVEKITSSREVSNKPCSLGDVLLRLDAHAGTGPHVRETMHDDLQQLHEYIGRKDLMRIRKSLEEKSGVVLEVDDLERLSTSLSFGDDKPLASTGSSHESAPVCKSSGDVLTRLLLVESSEVIKHVKTFDALAVCRQLSAHLRTQSGTNITASIWRNFFGADTTDAINMSDFLDGILKAGFVITSKEGTLQQVSKQAERHITQLLLSLAVDEIRQECGPKSQTLSKRKALYPVVTFNLFTVMMRLHKLKEVELKFKHALGSFVQLSQGEQQHLVTVALDSRRNFIVRARDPVFKFAADFTLREDEYDFENLIAHFGSSEFDRRLQELHDDSREMAFTKCPHELITAELNLELNNAILSILSRLRVENRYHHGTNSSHVRQHILWLSLVESDSFVATLRGLLSQVEVPFFWSVSPRILALSIDSEYLEQQNKPSFQQIVAECLSLHGATSTPSLRALATFVSHTASSLLVRYEVVGKHTNVTSWQDFQDFIAGHQNTYALMELHPQGELFTTRVARTSGSGAVQWDFKKQIFIEEPKVCDHRIDRPVIFTDTVKVSGTPGSGAMAKSINFVVNQTDDCPGHFVVVSVRRALPVGPESKSPRLYCTAYDPLTSCDYAVEGYPPDWPVDFFDATANPTYEEQWLAMLSAMHLGATLTPKLSVSVFNKHPKTDKLIGECEVSIGSAIALEGHIFEERIALQTLSSSAGVALVTFRFDVKKKNASEVDASGVISRHAQQSTGTSISIKLGAQYLAGEVVTPRPDIVSARGEIVSARSEIVKESNDARLLQYQASIASLERAKQEAQEQVRQLKMQVQQLSNLSNRTSDDSAERWKRKLDQAKHEQVALEEQYSKRMVAMQEEIRQLSEANGKDNASLREVSNLKDCKLSAGASASDILSAMKGILTSRCPVRPYNGLKKALAAEAEVPGKVTFAVLHDVLSDFGFALSSSHRTTLSAILDPEMTGRVSIGDFFAKLSGDAEAYAAARTPQSQSPIADPSSPIDSDEPSDPVVFTPSPPSVQRPASLVASSLRASNSGRVSTQRPKMAWQDMKSFLVLNLPEGWETRFTEKGRPYFCNHANRSTQWKHPRPEIETVFSEWVQENGANFTRRSTSARASRRKQ